MKENKNSSSVSSSKTNDDCFNFKNSNIRIWIHRRDLGKLQQVVWEGYGSKLLVEHSNSSIVRKFIESVPHIMALIKEIHNDVIKNDFESLKKRTEDPVPQIVFSGKDHNGLTPLHKAAGLGRSEIAEYIISRYPQSLSIRDSKKRTPLHYAPLAKDDNKTYEILVRNGADEYCLDYREKSPAYYKVKYNELEPNLLQHLPDCPRTAKQLFEWDWNLLTSKKVNGQKRHHKQNGSYTNRRTEPNNPDSLNKSTAERRKENDAQDSQEEYNSEDNTQTEDSRSEYHHLAVPDEQKKPEEALTKNTSPEKINRGATSTIKKQESKISENGKQNMAKSTESTPEDGRTTKSKKDSNEIENHDEARHESTAEKKKRSFRSKTQRSVDIADKGMELGSMLSKSYEEKSNSKKEANSKELSKINSQKVMSPSQHFINEEIASSTHKNGSKENEDGRTQEGERKSGKSKDDKNYTVSYNENSDEGIIEGVVYGENEVESVNEEGSGHINKEVISEVDDLIKSESMEQLAALVLNGNGNWLVGHKSNSSEIQAFLDNVPTYMSKIHRIHSAARSGSLKDLQAALDRRKFAIAKDHISPNGATALHVAVLFGNTSIVRYLAGRFPETVNTIDDNGRSPLHFAATLDDNGHYYNLLTHLGADPNLKDNMGFTADYYRTNREKLSHRYLLTEFGGEDLADEILKDKVPNDEFSAKKDLDDSEILEKLEKCFHVLNNYKGNFASSVSNNFHVHIKPHIVLHKLKFRLTKCDHNLYDVIWPIVKKIPDDEREIKNILDEDFPSGIIAPDLHTYKVFSELFEPILKEWHLLSSNDPITHPKEELFQEHQIKEFAILDEESKYIIAGFLECTRNLKDFEVPKCLTIDKLQEVEKIIVNVIINSKSHVTSDYWISGSYYPLEEILTEPSEIRLKLAANGLLIPLSNLSDAANNNNNNNNNNKSKCNPESIFGNYWPIGRGVYVNDNVDLAIWINVIDHIRILISTSSIQHQGDLAQLYIRLRHIINKLRYKLHFARDESLGYMSSRPTIVGTCLHFRLLIKLPNLTKEPKNLKRLCNARSLTCKIRSENQNFVVISNKQCLGITEYELFKTFWAAVDNLLHLEENTVFSVPLTTTVRAAVGFLRIFNRKKTSS